MVKGYCMKCRLSREIVDPKKEGNIIKGTCEYCGSKMARIISKDESQLPKDLPAREKDAEVLVNTHESGMAIHNLDIPVDTKNKDPVQVPNQVPNQQHKPLKQREDEWNKYFEPSGHKIVSYKEDRFWKGLAILSTILFAISLILVYAGYLNTDLTTNFAPEIRTNLSPSFNTSITSNYTIISYNNNSISNNFTIINEIRICGNTTC